MKFGQKMLAVVLAATMSVSMAACGAKPGNTETGKEPTPAEAPADAKAPEAPADAKAPEAPAEAEAPAAEEGAATDATGVQTDKNGNIVNPEAVAVADNELSFWSLFSGGDGDFMDQIIGEYNATNPEMKVKPIRLDWGEYYTKLMTAVAADDGPDIGVSHTSKLPELVDQGAVMSFDDYADVAPVDWAAYNANVLNATVIGDKHYTIPIDTHAEIMYYNVDLCKAAGVLNDDGTLKVENGMENWDKLFTQLKDNLPEGVVPMAISNAGDDPWRMWWAFYFQLGGKQMINDEATEVVMDVDKAVESAKYMRSLYEKGFIAPNIEDSTKFFQNGMSAMFLGGVWSTGALEKVEGFNFKARPIPTVFGNEAYWADSHTFVLPLHKNPDKNRVKGAIAFMDFATKDGAVWAQAGHIPSRPEVISSDAFKKLPYRSDYAAVAEKAVFQPKIPVNWPAKVVMIQNLDLIWNGTSTPEEGIQKMINEIPSVFQ